MTSHGDQKGWLRTVRPVMAPPSLKDNTADADRLIKGIRKAEGVRHLVVDLPVLRRLPSLLREYRYDVLALICDTGVNRRLVDLFPAGREAPLWGIAADLGSSTIVVRLVNLVTAEVAAEASFLNPQDAVGPDILTRIHFASREGGLSKLQGSVLESLNREIGDLVKGQNLDTGAVVGMTLAGNTTMTHLFLGLDPMWLCREPYIPAVNRPEILTARDLGVGIHPEAPVLVFPNAGSYFGGDLIAGILASGMTQREEISILVDVGTNAEVALGNREWLMACAGAAGPALEGGVAGMGMAAAPGVIDKVAYDGLSGKFQIRTIEGKPPLGICGSGLIDLLAGLFLAGMVDLRGKFVNGKCGERLKEMDGIHHFVVVDAEDSATGRPLTLAQTDIDALLRSKAAMYTILLTITRMINIPFSGIGSFYLAGTFGSYIDPQSAVTLGMIPDLPLDTYRPLGNASLEGATRVLLSAAARDEIYEIRDRITYVELNVNQEFMNLFNAARFIPHTDSALFPSVGARLRKELS